MQHQYQHDKLLHQTEPSSILFLQNCVQNQYSNSREICCRLLLTMLCKFCKDLDLNQMCQRTGQVHHEGAIGLYVCGVLGNCDLCRLVIKTLNKKGPKLDCYDNFGVPMSCWFDKATSLVEWRQVFILPDSGFDEESFDFNKINFVPFDSMGKLSSLCACAEI
jgi:hypothetical protein